MNYLQELLNGKTLSMEQQITIDNNTTLKLFGLAAAIILLFFISKKYIK